MPFETRPSSSSLTKLRTALICRRARPAVIDLDGDVLWGPATLPPEAAARRVSGPGQQSSTDDFNQHLRTLVGAIGEARRAGGRFHLKIAAAVTGAAANLEAHSKPRERGLRQAIAARLEPLVDEPIASSATGHEVNLVDVPGWTTRPGPLDLAVGENEQHPQLVAEMKWAKKRTFSHSVWDILKIIGALAKSAEAAYLISGYPRRVWESRSPFATLHHEGVTDFAALPLEKEWPFFRRASPNSVPDSLPRKIDVAEICRVSLVAYGEPWELRAVAIEPCGGWLRLPNGDLEGAIALAAQH